MVIEHGTFAAQHVSLLDIENIFSSQPTDLNDAVGIHKKQQTFLRPTVAHEILIQGIRVD
jgi:hypothetical protein